jgi:hypothetical protein
MVEQDEPTNIPLGVSPLALNTQFALTRARTRYGINKQIGPCWTGFDTATAQGAPFATGAPVTGLESFKFEGNGVAPDITVPIVFDQNGNLLVESPAGSGRLQAVASTNVTPGPNNYMIATQTLNRGYLAFCNLKSQSSTGSGQGSSAGASLGVLGLQNLTLDPNGMKPVGVQWSSNTAYRVGECVTGLINGNGNGAGKLFRCTTAGTSGANEPAWNPGDSATTNDGKVVWTENTPIFSTAVPSPDLIQSNGVIVPPPGAQVPLGTDTPTSGFQLSADVAASGGSSGGSFGTNLDVYFAATLVNPHGESDAVAGIVIQMGSVGTTGPLTCTVTQTIRSWLANLSSSVKPTGWNLYEVDQPSHTPAPPLSAYKKVAGGPFSLNVGTQVTISVSATGPAPPTTNTATLGSPGGIIPASVPASGLSRWMVVLYQNRNGYISGYGRVAPVQNNFEPIGEALAVNIPIGPSPETAARILALTEVGGTQAGPFAYISNQDIFDGLLILSTIINDNVSTTALIDFNDVFLDAQLSTTQNVTSFSDKIQAPPCRNIYYSKTLDRVFYLAYELPSGAWVSPEADPETIFGSTAELEVNETDGQTLWGIIDWGQVTWGLKEEGGWEINTSPANASQWTSVRIWEGSGPCGPKAFDGGAWFFSYVHRSGVYACFGSTPERITKEISKTWRRINWNAATTIWLTIDDDTHQIYIGVPLDNSTTPSHILVCNFEEDHNLGPPIHSTIYSRGKFISSAACRKWSLWEIPASSCVRAKRLLLNPPNGMDAELKISQLLFGSSADGSVNAYSRGVYGDNGRGINWIYETACPGDSLKDTRFGGAQAMMQGNGRISVSALADMSKSSAAGNVNRIHSEFPMAPAFLTPGIDTDYSCNQEGRNERWRLRFSHVGQPAGTWADIKWAALYLNPVFQAGPG